MKTRTKEADSGGIAIFLIILLQISKLSCTAALTFDNQLVIVSNDCYTRVAIGSKLPDADVLSTTEVKSISECEDECSRRRNLCNSFSFGVGTRGNGTCAISGKTPKPDDLSIDPDYDVYIRSQLSPYCAPDKLYKIGDSNKDWVNNSSSTGFGNGLLTIFPNVVQPQRSGGRNESDTNRSNFKAYINDEERRITDIVRNRNPGNILDHPFFGNHFAAPHRFNDHPVSFEEDTRFHDDRGNNFGQRLHPYDTNDDYYDTYSNRKPFIGENRHFTRPNIQHSIFDNEEYAGNYNFHKNDLSSSTPKPLQSDVLKSTIFNIARSKSPTKNFGAKAEESSSESPASAGGFQHSSEFFDNNPTSFHNEAPNVFSSLISVQDGYPQTALRPFNYWTNRVPGGFHYRTNRYRNNWDDYQDSPKFNDQFSSGKSPTEFGRWTGYNGGGTHPYSSDGSYSNRNVFTNPLFIHNLPKHTTVKPTDTYWTTPTPAFFQYTTIGHLKRRDQNSGNLSNNSDLDYTNPDDAALTTPSGYGMKIQEEPKSCYRRVLSGKKITENHVRRAIECERISDCNRACDYEKYFVCEGFNYRRTGPGTRGTCELTSTAYPRIDMQRDFAIDSQCDYYERDENCQKAEPNERPQWWSYGTPSRPANEYPRSFNYDRRPVDYDQASGYPPPYRRPNPVNRRPVDPYPDRYQPDRSYDRPYHPRYPDNNYYYRDRDRPYPKYPERRIDQRPYPDIGSNEIGPFLPENRPDFNRDWRYGGSFGYNTNNIGSYDASKIPVKRPQRPEKRPLDNDRFYGEFYNYGGAFGYGDTYPPTSRDQIYGGNGKGQECSIRTAAGFKIGRGIVGKTFLTPNVDHCENLCANEKAFVCLTFAYRYNVESSDPTDNCLLSRVSYRDLNFYTDLEPDRNYDIYVMVGDIKTCSAKKPSNLPPPDECFWRVRSGFGMPPEVTKKTMTVDGIGNCQAQCTATQNFTCRSFAFRYESQNRPRNGDGSNCYLSDWPSQEINPVNMPDMDGAELYERGSYGRGCEPYPFSLMSPGRLADNSPPTQRDEGCYSGYHRPCKLTPYAVLLSMRAESEADCRQKCSRMRERDSVPCMSFSYKISGTGRDDNCMLSDVPIRDLRPGLDYTYDDNHVLYAYKELDPNCVIPGYGMDDDHVYGPNSGPNSGPGKPLYAGIGYSNVEGRPGYFGAVRPFVQGPRPQDQNYQGIRPVEPNRPNGGPYGQVPATISSSGLPGPMAPNRPGVSGGYGGSNGNGYPGYGSSNLNTDESTLNQYTVNGYPCKRNTRCERNKIAGFYSCETEGSEFGSWDYCCQPSHQCGYSEGFNYPWCYVGHSVDQWRPCSEKYYPYSPNSRPQRPPIGDPYGSNGDRGVYDPYTGRYWPIIYLHREPPPNSTDSVPSAADSTSTTEMRSINLTTTTLLPTEQTPDNQTEEQSSRLRKARRLRTRTVPDENNIATPDDYNTSKGNPILSRRTNARFNAFRSKTKDRAAKVERTFRSTVGQVKNGAKNANLLTMSTTAPSTNLFLTTQDFTNNSPKFSTDISDDDYIKSTDSKLFETPLILSNATSLI